MTNDRIEQLHKMGGFPLAQSKLTGWNDAYAMAVQLVTQKIPVILYGPPGTAKTRMAVKIRDAIASQGQLGYYEFIQFHQKFTYEDFMEGYIPSADGKFELRAGVFKKFCELATKTPEKIHLLVIDEFNRAEVATTLGETLFLLEDRAERKTKTAHSGTEFSIPNNVAILGTMNTADRTINTIDFALRRRFRFIPVFPDYHELNEWLRSEGVNFEKISVEDYVAAAHVINRRISALPSMGKNMQLGQTFFIPDKKNNRISEECLPDMLTQKILPQLEAYCGFGREDQIAKILTPQIAEKYIHGYEITVDDVVAMITALSGEHEAKEWLKKAK